MTDNELRVAVVLAEDMLAAGAEQLMRADPEKDDPLVTVARIWCAMELTRLVIEEAVTQTGSLSPSDKTKLN